MRNQWQQSLFLAVYVVLGIAPGALAEEERISRVQSQQMIRDIPSLGEVEQPLTTAEGLLVQQPAPALAQVTGVQLKPTEKGLEVILETTSEFAEVLNSEIENSLITDIPNAQLRLSKGEAFRQDNPTQDIASVEVVNLDAKTLRVTVTGKAGVPTAEVSQSSQALILSVVAPPAPAPQPTPAPIAPPPATPTPAEPQQPAVPEAPAPEPQAEEERLELTVTAEEEAEGYNVPDATTATKTDTPLRDIPQSIQVVPRQVLEDQNVTRLEEAVRNVPGVNQATAPYFTNGTFLVLRGFTARDDSGNVLRNGLPDPIGTRQIDFANIEQVEVLKGPASVLFGRANPGGTINLITKQPLSDPFYRVDATIGSYDFYRGAVDLSGPLNDSKTILYRLNAAYQDTGSFIDFVDSNKLFVAPVISFDLSDRTKLTLEGEISSANNEAALGVPADGSVSPNPNGRLPLSRNIGEPYAKPFDVQTYRIGYRLDHQFSDRLSLRNEFRFSSYYATIDQIAGLSLQADNRTLDREYTERTFLQQGYNFTTDLIGKFSTGSIDHQVVFGVDLSRFDTPTFTGIGREIAPLDIFDPVYGQRPFGTPFTRFDIAFVTDALGVYVQDQIALANNLKLLAGGRFDTFKRTDNDFLAGTEIDVSGAAFSPRVGIVYQPIEPVSLYASYGRSFTPVAGIAFDDTTFQPERGTQYEVGIKADLSDQISTTLALYDLTRSNVLVPDPDPERAASGFSIQTGKQRSRGIELSVGGEILPGWNIIAGYAYTDAQITEDSNPELIDNRLNNVPANTFNVWTTYEIQQGALQGLGAGLGFFYKGETEGDLNNSFTVPSYFRTDASVFYKRDGFRAAINIRNLFDLDYYEFATSRFAVYAAEPFTVQGTISWEF